jgi:hypothetical protein
VAGRMTKHEGRMTNDEGTTKPEDRMNGADRFSIIRHFIIPSSFEIRHSSLR